MLNFLPYIIVAICAYAIGSISPSYIIGRIKGVDVKKTGSKNLGASNATMVLGWRFGVLIGALDIAKGALAVLLTRFLAPDLPGIAYLAATCAVLGHIFPFYLKFKGGKGFATYIGIVAGLHFPVAVVLAVIIIAVALITDYIVVGTFTTVVAFPVFVYFYTGDLLSALLVGVASVVIIIKHWPNILRIKDGTEGKVRILFGKGHRERASRQVEELNALDEKAEKSGSANDKEKEE